VTYVDFLVQLAMDQHDRAVHLLDAIYIGIDI
jgi:hypothetical protein